MSSERRIRASRANGALSKGPVTDDGKKSSSANSLRHGILASSVVLEGEDIGRFHELLDKFERQFQPANAAEQTLVENLVVTRWRLMRIWCVEKATMGDEISRLEDTPDPALRTGLALRHLSDQSNILDLLARYETRFDRQYFRCLKLLRVREKKYLQNEPSPTFEHPER